MVYRRIYNKVGLAQWMKIKRKVLYHSSVKRQAEQESENYTSTVDGFFDERLDMQEPCNLFNKLIKKFLRTFGLKVSRTIGTSCDTRTRRETLLTSTTICRPRWNCDFRRG